MVHTPRFVSWAAVSSLPQTKKVSLEDQLNTNRAHIAKYDGRLVAELIVPGESRSIVLFEEAARRIEAYARLKELIDARAFDVLIFLDRSRLGRKASLSMAVVELCHDAGIATYETENPPASLQLANGTSHDDMLIGAIKSVGAQREIQKLQERHEMGMIARVKKGEFPSAVPFGWRAVFDPAGNRIIQIDEDAAAVIRLMILDFYMGRGMGIQVVADRLNQMGYRTPRGFDWQRANVQAILRKVWRYAGFGEINIRSHRPYTRARGAWPAIITEEDAKAVLAEVERRRKGRRSVSHTYLFSLCVWCAECGRRMIMATHIRKRKSGRMQKSLRCQYMEQEHRHRFISENKVRDAVRKAIAYLETPENRRQVLSEAGAGDNDRTEAEIVATRKRIEETRNQLYKADDMYIAGQLDETRYQRQVERLTGQIQGFEETIRTLQGKLEQIQYEERRAARLEEVASIGPAMLEHEDERIANAWLKRHFQIWVEDRQVVRIDYL